MDNKIGAIPEFTSEAPVEAVQPAPVEEEVVTPVATEPAEGTETPAEPLPAEVPPVDDTLVKQVSGLEREKALLLDELKTLRGVKREIKQEEIASVSKQIDELKDVNPDDQAVIEKVLRAKGYITKDEASQMSYQAIQIEVVNAFLDKYPEYKPENDPENVHWNALNREVELYRKPSDAKKLVDILERAHKAIAQPSNASVQAAKQRVAVASLGTGGRQTSSTPTHSKLTPRLKEELLRGGWSEEEVNKY